MEKIPIIISPMKTGSTSLWKAVLSKYNPQQIDYKKYHPQRQHLSYMDKIKYGRADTQDRFVLTIRNPYSIIISLYGYLRRGHIGNPAGRAYDKDFGYFLENDYHRINGSLLNYVEGCPEYDVIRYETYVEDIKKIFYLDINDYRHWNWGNNGPTTVDSAIKQMKPEHIKFINEQYHDDFVAFGYEMVDAGRSKQKSYKKELT